MCGSKRFSGLASRLNPPPASPQSLATSLSLVWAMDQKNKLLLRATAQTRSRLTSYISEAKKPLAAIRTLGGILERQFRPGEAPRDLATAIQEQGTQLSDLAGELQVALYSDTGLLPEPAEAPPAGQVNGGGGASLEPLPPAAAGAGAPAEGAAALGAQTAGEPAAAAAGNAATGHHHKDDGHSAAIDAEVTAVSPSASVTDVTPTPAAAADSSGSKRRGGSGTGNGNGSATAAASPAAVSPPPPQQQQRPGRQQQQPTQQQEQPKQLAASAAEVVPHAPSRVTHPRRHSATEQCSVPSVLRPLLGAMDGIARSSRVTLVADVPEDRNKEEPFTALANSRDVKRVLSLILETALQQTPPGGKMEVRVSRQRTLEGSAVVVEVACRTAKGAPAQGVSADARSFPLAWTSESGRPRNAGCAVPHVTHTCLFIRSCRCKRVGCRRSCSCVLIGGGTGWNNPQGP